MLWGTGAGLVTLAVLGLIARGSSVEPLPEYWTAPAFELVDQTSSPLRREDLLGSVWVASFIFTRCEDVCPAISARMAGLAADLEREAVLGEEVRLVSFTVDPERDTPEVLREYAAGFGGLPPSKWAFLTGAPGDTLRALIERGFKLTAMMPEPAHEAHDSGVERASYQVMHSPRVMLVDRAGVVRGIYDAMDAESMKTVVGDALALVRQ